MRCASIKSFFQAVMNVLLYILKDPKEEKGVQNRWQGKDWRKTSGRQCICHSFCPCSLYAKIVHINPLLKAMFQAERFDSESDVSTLYDIV